jgi:hypothetical protein
MFGRPLAYRAVTAGSGRIKIRQNLPTGAYQAKSLGKSRSDGRDMPTVAPTIARIATVGEAEGESWQNPPNLDNQFFTSLHRLYTVHTVDWQHALCQSVFGAVAARRRKYFIKCQSR